MATLPSQPPITEIGSEQPLGGVPSGVLGSAQPWWTFVDYYEETPELQWPASVRTFNKMRTDSQVEALYFGSTLPIRRYKWSIDPNGADDAIVEGVRKDFNLPLKGEDHQNRPRLKGRFSWDTTLFHILLAPLYGHMYFEQVGRIGDDNKWHLDKLSPRMPDTLQEIKVAPDGGLVSIRQMTGILGDDIPVDRLVAYIWGKEGANWAGRSMLRSIYKDFVIKDRLVRVDAMKHDRNGMGVPIIEAPPNASPQEIASLNNLALGFRAGERAGGAIPNGAKLSLVGVTGTTPDTIASIQQRDEAMARRFLMMFMQLGQTQTGSRALGGAFIDWFALAQEAIADWVCDITTEHVIEDWVDWNYGEDVELTPRLHYERDEDTQLAAADLAQMVSNGVITVDDELEAALRARYDLPDRDPNKSVRTQTKKVDSDGNAINQTPPAPPVPSAPTEEPPVEEPAAAGGGSTSASTPPEGRRSERSVRADTPPALNLPARKLRRQPYKHELAAQTDYAAMDIQWAHGVDNIVTSWGPVRATQIDALHQAVIDAKGSLSKLAGIQAPAVGADVLAGHLKTVAEQGAHGAITEAAKQGVTIHVPEMDKVNSLLDKRATAVDELLANALSQAASQRAVRITGGSLEPTDVASNVKDYLNGLTDTWLRDQLGGAVTAAQNAGRFEVVKSGPPSQLYASELLDSNTCEECTAIDGTPYESIDEAQQDYPTGGYLNCAGGPRCRGTAVAVYDEAAPDATGDGE